MERYIRKYFEEKNKDDSHIKIISGKKYDTKKIMSGDNNLRIYRKVPKNIKFKSKMVNDENQHFCGGWSVPGKDLSDKALLNRVIQDKKPFGFLTYDDSSEFDYYMDKIKKAKLDYFTGKNKHGFNFIEFAHKGTLESLFDLKTLKQDYMDNNIAINTNEYASKKLSDFFSMNWDIETNPMWVTGLILGYPIENTISLYRQ